MRASGNVAPSAAGINSGSGTQIKTNVNKRESMIEIKDKEKKASFSFFKA